MRGAALVLSVLGAACRSGPPDLARPVALATLEPGEAASRELAAELSAVLAELAGDGAVPPAGLRARLAFHLARLGEGERARRLLAAETADHPDAKAFVDALAEWLREREEP